MKYNIKSRIWNEADDKVLLGEGRVSLLKEIDKTGSLSKAAKSLGMSYKKAWALVDMMNRRAEKPITESSVGGRGGGGVIITDYGMSLIKLFEGINKKCWNYLDKQIELSEL